MFEGDLLYKCWIPKEDSAAIQIVAVRKPDGHLDLFISRRVEGQVEINHRCGLEKPFPESELYEIVDEIKVLMSGAGLKLELEYVDFTPFKTAEDQIAHMNSLGWDLERRQK